ncbi:hypothetical protein HK405_009166 [Cladochytrium tenue]|nr:hypothetical protein HK405_009166 [Cladochytrium tenue]
MFSSRRLGLQQLIWIVKVILGSIVEETKDLRVSTSAHMAAALDLAAAVGAPGTIGFRVAKNGRHRELAKWVPDTADSTFIGGLDVCRGDWKWDQFAVNKKLFGVTTDFDELLYTTKIDKSTTDYKQREARARQIALEIENDARMSDNVHILEERNVIVPSDGLDEEERYSSVIRESEKLYRRQPN